MPDGELLGLVERVAGWARDGEQVEAFASRGTTTSVRAYGGEVESLTSATPAGIGVRVVAGGRQGFAWAGGLDEAILKETLTEARDNAAFGQPDECNGLADPDPTPRAELDLYRSDLAAVPTAAKVEAALELERLVRDRPGVTGIRTAAYHDSLSEQALATSTGIRSWGRATVAYAAVSAMAADGDSTHMGGGVTYGRSINDLDLDEAAVEAAERATRMRGAGKPRSARVTVVLDPGVTHSLLGIIGGTLSGEAVLKGRSLFADRVGEQVGADGVTLVDDPTDVASLGAWPDDDEGIASRRNVLVAGGRLQGFLHDTYSGRRSGAGSTGSAVRGFSSTPGVGARALTLLPGSRSRDELVAEVGSGVYVQDVSGLHSGVNPVSGDFSVGAEGLHIRDGELAEPFREATIASTLQRMLLDVVAVGSDQRWFGSGAGMTLVLRDVSLGGA